ncbi:isochorismatase family protein [Aureimonas fodinaquatilis]|uniref:Isochorismatase family protein n=1 Tax=Aureimonas fodinaquatilis TaxID=2565783 RepID=A0A5B0DT90_9HYPH|nr:isochorismatase family protein [Aureimonas fodinaquatilis]KAA0969628.1 isochorismatase family protein [Aureimonas fodinaquatilis]
MTYEAEVRPSYLLHGFGGRIGFGQRPALVVIDLARSWLDESSQQGSCRLEPVLEHTLSVLAAAREAGHPVFFTTMQPDPVDVRGPIGRKMLQMSSPRALATAASMAELDPRLERRNDEPLFVKARASAFWGTPFDAYLNARGVDTLIITGCSTSGCIRATAESAINRNLHSIIVREAVGDRSPTAHEANLTDIDLRYGDVVTVAETVAYLRATTAEKFVQPG